MDYDEFVRTYESNLRELLKYKPSEIGSIVFSEKLGELSDKYPEFMEKYEAQTC